MGNQIGTLSEKSIHSFLKSYLEPDISNHEVKLGPYIADIYNKNNNHIIEIQTQNFKKLISKIDYYLQNNYKITIVYPVIECKYINYLDPVTSEIIKTTKSPRKGVIQDIFKELYWIIDYLDNDLFSLSIITLDANEFKYLDKKLIKIDKKPLKLNDIYNINNLSDLKILIPSSLPNEFTCKDFLKSTKCNKRWVGSGVKMLREHNIIKIKRKISNTYIYERNF